MQIDMLWCPNPGPKKAQRQPKASTLPTWFHRNLKDPNMTQLMLRAIIPGSWCTIGSLVTNQWDTYPQRYPSYFFYSGSSKSDWAHVCTFDVNLYIVLSSSGTRGPSKGLVSGIQSELLACMQLDQNIFHKRLKRFSSLGCPIFKHLVNGLKFMWIPY